MEVLIVFLVTLLVAVPVLAVVALCYAIAARRRVEELQDSLNSLRLDFRRLGEDSGGRAPPVPGEQPSKAETFRQARATDRSGERAPAQTSAEEDPGDDWPSELKRGETEDEAFWSPPAAVGGVPLEARSTPGETSPLEKPLPFGDPMLKVVETLRRFGCLPPADDDRVEASLGAWWATRLGIVMAVIAAVFFGYVSCLFAFTADLETFAWGGGMLLGAGAGALLLARHWRYPLAIALVGAWAVVALFVITYFSGEVRWIALLVQAACLLPLLRERLRFSMDVVFHSVLAAGVGLFLYHRFRHRLLDSATDRNEENPDSLAYG